MVMGATRRAAPAGERRSGVGRLPGEDVGDVDDVGIGGVDLDLVKVSVAAPQAVVAVDEAPVLAAIVRAVQPAAARGAEHGVDAGRRARGDAQPDASQPVPPARQAPPAPAPRGAPAAPPLTPLLPPPPPPTPD